MSACSLSWPSARWEFTASSWAAGLRTATIRCWERCAAPLNWSVTKRLRAWPWFSLAAGRHAFDERPGGSASASQGVWFIFVVAIGFFIYLVGSIAETNRAPFDLPEAESELVAGYMTEYSGFRWSLYFLAEYANMVVVAGIATTLFLGGWMRPFAASCASVRHVLELLDVPPRWCSWVSRYSASRAGSKQPVQIQKLVMALVGGLLRGAGCGDMAGAAAASPDS